MMPIADRSKTLNHQELCSVVSTAHVLEHIPVPKGALAAAHRLLRKNGVLFLSMPNMESMVWRLLHANGVNPYWGEIEHFHNFSRRRLYTLLENQGSGLSSTMLANATVCAC